MKKIPQHIPQDSCKPKIDYPCEWQYKIIGEGSGAIQRIVEETLQEQPFTLTDSNVSSGGRYVSMNLELIVQSEEQRLELYRILARYPEIKVVL